MLIQISRRATAGLMAMALAVTQVVVPVAQVKANNGTWQAVWCHKIGTDESNTWDAQFAVGTPAEEHFALKTLPEGFLNDDNKDKIIVENGQVYAHNSSVLDSLDEACAAQALVDPEPPVVPAPTLSATAYDCDSFGFTTTNAPEGSYLYITWDRNNQGQFTKVGTSWWSGNGQYGYSDAVATLYNKDGEALLSTKDAPVNPPADCTPVVVVPASFTNKTCEADSVAKIAYPEFTREYYVTMQINDEEDTTVPSELYGTTVNLDIEHEDTVTIRVYDARSKVLLEEYTHQYLTNDGINPECIVGGGGGETPADPKPSVDPAPVTPVVAAAATPTTLPVPSELPMTGGPVANARGVIVSIAAALATYGAVYFARNRRVEE